MSQNIVFPIVPQLGGWTLAATVRNILDANGNAVRIELAPASPFAGDPEFKSTSLAAWTKGNSAQADTFDAHTTVLDHLCIKCSATSSDFSGATVNAPFLYQVISGDFDLYGLFSSGRPKDFAGGGIIAQSTSAATSYFRTAIYGDSTQLAKVTLQRRSTLTGTNTDTNALLAADEMVLGGLVWLRLKRATSVFSSYYSINNLPSWTQIGTSVDRSGDFSANANLGITVGTANTDHGQEGICDYIRSWPPFVTTSPTAFVVIDSGTTGTQWQMNTFQDYLNEYKEYSPQAQIGFGTLNYQYGASDTNPPTLNGSNLSTASMQAQANPTGRYFKLQVALISANGYDTPSFNGATITGAVQGIGPVLLSRRHVEYFVDP